MKNRKIPNWPLLLLVLLSSNFVLAEELVSKSYFGSVAIGGHDTVAYHRQELNHHKATEGKKSYTVEWRGAKWRFVTRADSEAFAAEPEKYAPAYNGFCANALSLGNGLVKTDGTHWQIFEDQLFLFSAKKGRNRWLDGNYKEFKTVADRAWQEFSAGQGQ